MTILPEEAVKAAENALMENRWLVPGPAIELILTAALPHLPQGVGVKKLDEWTQASNGKTRYLVSVTVAGDYTIALWGDCDFRLSSSHQSGWVKYDTIEAAKAAAQADYEARILSALEPSAVQSDELLFRRKDIQRGLILFRTSNNAHDAINFVALTSKIDGLSSEDKDELAGLMRSYADSISSRKSPTETPAARKLALEEAARLCETHIETIGRTRALEYHNPLNGEKHSGMTYAAAIRALSSPDHADAGKVEGDGWLPIESAPKDGTHFLVWGSWKQEEPAFIAIACSFGEEPGRSTGWWVSGVTPFYPRKWLPLPSAPSQEVAGS